MKRKIQSSNTLVFILKTLAVIMVLISCGCGGESLGVEKKSPVQQKFALQNFRAPDLTSDPKVDEQLFMIRQLEYLYSQWPRDFDDPKKVAKDLANVRQRLVRGQEYAKEKIMEKRLIDMYEESIKLADSYGNFLKNVKLIDGDFYDKKSSEDFNNVIDKTTEGFGVGTALAVAGVEPISASAIIVGMMIKSAIDSNSKAKKHEREKALAIEKETNKYLSERSKTFGKIEVQVDVLAEKLKLKPLEVGFDQENNDDEKVYKAWKDQDLEFLLLRVKNLKKIRPRDPFVYFESGLILDQISQVISDTNTLKSDSDCEEVLKLAVNDYIRAVQLVPRGKQHNFIRADFIKSAASSASKLLYYSKNKDELPIWLANNALEIQPLDSSGSLRLIKSYALARNGRYDESLQTFEDCKPIIGDSYNIYFDWACLLSLAGKYDESFEKLKIAWDKGFKNVKQIKRDRDLSALRDKKKDDFDKLIKTTIEVGIDYGFVWNNVGFTNNSGFDLSNFVSRNIWCDKSGKEYVEIYFAEKLQNKKTLWFKGVFDEASQSNYRNYKYSYSCNEKKSLNPIGVLDCNGSYNGHATYMAIDCSDIQSTEKIQLEVFTEKDKVRVAVNGVTIITRSPVEDCSAKQIEKTSSAVLFFDNKKVYGWYQLPKDIERGFIRSFWVEKE